MNKVRMIVTSVIIASVVGMWMLLFAFFAQALGPGTVAHDIETVFEDSPRSGKSFCCVGNRQDVCIDDWNLWPEALN
jgi:hypothetical protein